MKTSMTRRLLGGMLAVLIVVGVARLSCAADSPVTIYIGVQSHDGFVDVTHEISDSIKDIQDKFRGSKLFRIVSAPEQAVITLSVVGRTKDKQPVADFGGASSVSVGGGAVVMLNLDTRNKCKCRTIYTVLKVGAYEMSLESHKSNSDSWRATADYVLRDVTAWVEANRAELARQPK